MTEHLLLASLGPVQDFIASARRCQDLWFGSWLLSELSKAAAAGMIDCIGTGDDAVGALVFPGATARAALERGSDTSVANKILVRIRGDAAHVREVAQAGEKAMRARLTELRSHAFRRAGRDDPARAKHFHERSAIAQVDDLIEYYWVAVPEPPDGDGYATARAEAERLLAARKNTRTWGQPSWAADGIPKSTLDGARESVLDESIFDTPVTGALRRPAISAKERRVWYGVHGAERLCGVGVLKRQGVQLDAQGRPTRERFFSTSHVAALPLMIGLERDEARASEIGRALVKLTEAIERIDPAVLDSFDVVHDRVSPVFGRLDGSLLFPNRLVETLEEFGFRDRQEEARAAVRRFLDEARRSEPGAYYAILVADGDRMGAAIDNQRHFDHHRQLSIALDNFAREAGAIVRKHDGSLIYSGGDDVLAFLPLHRAVACARALADAFRQRLSDWPTRDGDRPSLSAGLGIVHHLEPMRAALDVARGAERLAKHEGGRNALGIVLSKRAGATVEVVGKWDKLVPRLNELVKLHRCEAISDKAGHELAELALLTKNAEPAALEMLRQIQRSEAMRILRRKRASRGAEALTRETLERLETMLEELRDVPSALGNELVIAAHIAAAMDQAGEALS